jgi:transcriptional regulator with XRE-family HTH domain
MLKVNIEKLNWIRIEQGLSITALAEKAKMSKATVSKVLRNDVEARPYTIGKIAIALEISAKELYIQK